MMLVPPCPAKAFPQRHIPKSWACELWDKTLTAFKSVAHVSFPPTTNEDWCLSSAGPDQGNGIFGLKPNCLVEEDEQNKAKNSNFPHLLPLKVVSAHLLKRKVVMYLSQ